MQRIPITFQIAGLTFTVALDDKLAEATKQLGIVDYHQQKIVIDPSHAPKETTEQAYFHELVHTILFIMNEDELQNNERFVDLFAHLLYQALSTSTYGVHNG